METKKYTAKVRKDLSEGINRLAQEQGITLREITERMMQNTLEAHRLAGEIREYCD